MYRRQLLLEMAAEQQGFPQSQFVSRVASLPVVHSAIEYASGGYGRIKESNGIIYVALTQAEKSLKFAAEQAKPAVHRLERPISFADSLACSGLDKLEQKLPVIKKSPEEIVDDTKKIYESTVLARYQDVRKLGTDKVRALTDYGMNKAYDVLQSPYGQLMIKSADSALSVTENYVDYYLPPTAGEKPVEEMGKKNFVERVETLSNKAKQRVYTHAVAQYHHVQKVSQEALARVGHTLELIQQAKNLDPRNGFSVAIHNVQNRAQWLWEELNKEPTENSDSKLALDQQILAIARRVTKQLVQSYTAYSGTFHSVPQNIQNRIAVGRKYASDMYNHFARTTHLTELSNAVLRQMQDNLKYMQNTLTYVVDSFLKKNSTKLVAVVENNSKPNDVSSKANDVGKANCVHAEEEDSDEVDQ